MLYKYYSPATMSLNNMDYELLELEHHILQQRRKELKLTQQQVADSAGIQLRQYQRFESGERNITGSSARIMLSVCEVLLLDPFVFLGKGNEKPEAKNIVLPPIEKQGLDYVIPMLAYYTIVSGIPRGMVCSRNQITKCIRKAYANDSLELGKDLNSIEIYANLSFPFWRVVSQRGFLIDNFYHSKEYQRTMLESEGIKTVNSDKNNSIRIVDFESRRFDTNNFNVTVMKTNEEIQKLMIDYAENKT